MMLSKTADYLAPKIHIQLLQPQSLLGNLQALRRVGRALLKNGGLVAVLVNDNNAPDGSLGALVDAQARVQLVGRITEQDDVGKVLLGVKVGVALGGVSGNSIDGVTSVRKGLGRVAEEASLRGAAGSGSYTGISSAR